MKSLSLLLLLFTAVPALAGNDVGNGGDAIDCVASGSSPFVGLYATDYLLTLGAGDAPPAADAQVRSLDESLRRIQRELDRLYPELASLFAEHVAELRNFSDWTRSRIWTPAAHGLIDVKDERITRRLPPNCGVDPLKRVVHLIQAVIRQVKPRIIQYQIDFDLQTRMQRLPLQLSYLLVHEWLWDFTEDPEAIRWANRLLHSATLEQMDPASFQAGLAGIGIQLRGYGYDRFCTRTDLIRGVLEQLTGQPCEQFTRDLILNLNPNNAGDARFPIFAMNLSKSSVDGLRFGDFSSLAHLKILDLSDNRLRTLAGEHFSGLSALDKLSLERNELSEVPARILDVLPQLRELRLENNRIEKIPAGLLRNAFSINALNLSGNKIRELPRDLLVTRRQGPVFISLQDNAIESLPPGFFDDVPRGPGERALVLHLSGNPIPQTERLRINKEAEYRRVQIFF